jgi:hypothetical protein
VEALASSPEGRPDCRKWSECGWRTRQLAFRVMVSRPMMWQQPPQFHYVHCNISPAADVLTKEQAMPRPALVALCAAIIATEATAQSTGIAGCDDFLRKYEVCINTKVPADQRDVHKGILNNYRKSFGDLAKDPVAKPGVESSCKTVAEQIEGLLRLVDCTF